MASRARDAPLVPMFIHFADQADAFPLSEGQLHIQVSLEGILGYSIAILQHLVCGRLDGLGNLICRQNLKGRCEKSSDQTATGYIPMLPKREPYGSNMGKAGPGQMSPPHTPDTA